MSGQKNVIVTGSTGAIGRAITKNITLKNGYRVTMIARNEEKVKSVVSEINRLNPDYPVEYHIADLSSKKQTKKISKNSEIVYIWQK